MKEKRIPFPLLAFYHRESLDVVKHHRREVRRLWKRFLRTGDAKTYSKASKALGISEYY